MIELFHFLRPLWLLAIPLIGIAWWLLRRREVRRSSGAAFIAMHLREALTINRSNRQRFNAVDAVCAAMLAMAAAAAGPTWSQQPSPWFAEAAPLVIALEVSDSMRSNDLLPTRLDRARFKILDLAAARTGARTALIAYAGSAHVVVPPSNDVDVLKPLLESLDPAIMPESGANASAVLPRAQALLGEQTSAGTLVFVNDGFDSSDIAALAAFAARADAPAMAALVVGSDEGGVALLPDGSPVITHGGGRIDTGIDRGVLRRVANEADMPIVRASVGDADINELLRAIQSSLRRAEDPDAQWIDQGWWLLWPTMVLSLLWFRRGWAVPW